MPDRSDYDGKSRGGMWEEANFVIEQRDPSGVQKNGFR